MWESRLTRVLVVATLFVAAAFALLADDGTPALTLVGALVLAVIAAEAADTRQSRQLEAESGRLSAQLLAEADRLSATLRNNLDLADVADERALLDEAAVAVYRANDALADVESVVRRFGRTVAEHRQAELAALRERGRALEAILPRLSIRYGTDEPVLRALYGAVDALDAVSSDLAWLEDDDAESWKSKRAKLEADGERWREGIRSFEAEAVKRVGSRPGFTDWRAPN